VRGLDDECRSGPGHAPELAQDADVLVALEVPERREQGQHGIEDLVLEGQLAIVAADEPRPLRLASAALCLGELAPRAVEARDEIARLGERDGVPAEAARAVEDLGSGLDLRERGCRGRLLAALLLTRERHVCAEVGLVEDGVPIAHLRQTPAHA
jgi:hypothetical protein